MAHHIYHTDAIVLDSSPHGEASRSYRLFTRELGSITALAQSARTLQSKLRLSLPYFSLVEVALVRAKNGWRITNAIERRSYWQSVQSHTSGRVLFGQITFLLKRVVQGEDPNPEMFDIVHEMFQWCDQNDVSADKDFIDAVEAITVLRVLHILGYVAPDTTIAEFCSGKDLDDSLLLKAYLARSFILTHINKALSASNL